jgi:hypothetical protein
MEAYVLQFHNEIVTYNKIFHKFITGGNHHGYNTYIWIYSNSMDFIFPFWKVHDYFFQKNVYLKIK